MTEVLYQIRQADSTELPLLPPIECAAGQLFAQTEFAYLADGAPISLALLTAQQQQGLVWVALAEHQQPVGFALALLVDGEIYLQELSVHPAHGRRGLGRRLLAQLCRWASEQGYSSVTLSTFRNIPWNAPFYARLGFVPLEQADLSPSLKQIQSQEAAAGLPGTARVFMRLQLGRAPDMMIACDAEASS